MKLLNIEIEPLYTFLYDLDLKGKESRMRTRFLKLLQSRIQEVYDFQNEILDKYAEKDDLGKIKTKEVDGQEIYCLKNTQEYRKELKELLIEEFIIDSTPERKEMLLTIKDIILQVDLSFSGQDALQYDRWCELFESVD